MSSFIVGVALFLIGGFVAVLIRRKPEFFWPFLIVLPLATSGLMIAGHAVVDEYFLAALVAGGFLAARRGLVSLRTGKEISPHGWVFVFTVLYFVLQSIRGTIVFEDVRILRWVGYFLLFGALFFLVRRWRFPLPQALSVAKLVAFASTVHFGGYLILGLVSECAFSVWRWASQGVLFAGSSYAAFPVIFSFPAAVFLLRTEDKNARRLGWLTLFVSVLAVGYYESRIGWLALFAMLAFVPFVLGLQRALRAAPGLLLVFGFAILFTLSPVATPYSWGGQLETPYCHTLLIGRTTFREAFERLTDPKWYEVRANSFTKEIAETVNGLVAPRPTDVDRSLHFKAGLLVSTETPLRFLFGGGTYAHRSLLYRPLQQLYQTELPGTEVSPEVRTVGVSAVLVDFGFVGLALIALNLLFSMKALTPGRGLLGWRGASILLAALVLVPLWLSVVDIQDMVIYLLLLMPGNVFTLLVRDAERAVIL